MKIDVLTLFPEMFSGPMDVSIVGRARKAGLLDLRLQNLRQWTHDRHKTVDDKPFGGGAGMVLKPEPIFRAVETLLAEEQPESLPGDEQKRTAIVLMSPQGRTFCQAEAGKLASECSRMILLCGRYEGVDERVVQHLVTDEISIGDYVLTGGEIPAMVVVDAVTRLLPNVLGSDTSAVHDSFGDYSGGLLDYPHYTRPADFRGWQTPEVLIGGNHAEVAKWRRRAALLKTLQRRPELLNNAELTNEERRWLAEADKENEN